MPEPNYALCLKIDRLRFCSNHPCLFLGVFECSVKQPSTTYSFVFDISYALDAFILLDTENFIGNNVICFI